MKTDDLIRILAADAQPAPSPPLAQRLVLGVIPALLLAALALWLTLGFRADLAQAVVTPVSAVRFVLTGALGLVAMRIALLLARPEGRGLVRLWPLAAVAVAAMAVLAWGYLTTPAEGRQMALVGKTMVYCLTVIPLMSILPVAVILIALRQGATTAPALSGFVAGLAGGGLSAAVYALHCTEDSPLFYVTWYSLAIMSVTLVTTVIGTRVLRW